MAHVSLLLARASLVALAVSIAGGAGPAFANSSGGSGSGGSGGSAPACKPGYVYDANKQTCVKSSSMNDEQLYQQGRDLALAGRYDEALGVLAAVRNQSDARVLTMIGYSKRKLGNFDEGVAYYNRALAIDPSNADTREYLGEAYVETGRMDLAKAELANVEALCGTECEQYQDLAAAIDGKPDE
ncbi:MAG TPA: tetratricopeptide repeat protein [Dongiaceae bacterium]|nr:tetratricopeptide repeat protein [Dongiaceae bacterium]